MRRSLSSYALYLYKGHVKHSPPLFPAPEMMHDMIRSGAGLAQAVQCLPPGWEIGVRSPAGAKDFSSSLCVQTGSGAHPASCTMSTGGPFPGGKARPGRDADHSPPSSAEVVNE
jgi:hypothetical protein